MNSVPNFDALARPYRWLEYLTFGPLLHRCRLHFLPHVAGCRHALVLGDGDGRFTAALLSAHPQIHVHAVDLSPVMLQILQESALPHRNRLTTEAVDLREWNPNVESRYDLIASHFFLDCLTTPEVASLARRLAPAATPNAIWLVSDFAIPRNRFGQIVARPLVTILYMAFRFITGLRVSSLPDHELCLTASEWFLHVEDRRLHGLLFSQLWRKTDSALPNSSLSS